MNREDLKKAKKPGVESSERISEGGGAGNGIPSREALISARKKKDEEKSSPSPSEDGTFASGAGTSGLLGGRYGLELFASIPPDKSTDRKSQDDPAWTPSEHEIEQELVSDDIPQGPGGRFDDMTQGLTMRQKSVLDPLKGDLERLEQATAPDDEEQERSGMKPISALKAEVDNAEGPGQKFKEDFDILQVEAWDEFNRLKGFADTYNNIGQEAELYLRSVPEHVDEQKEGMVQEMLAPSVHGEQQAFSSFGEDPVVDPETGKVSLGESYEELQDPTSKHQLAMVKEYRKTKELADLKENRESMIASMGEEAYEKKRKKVADEIDSIRDERFGSINEQIEELEKRKEQIVSQGPRTTSPVIAESIQQEIDRLKDQKGEVFTMDPDKLAKETSKKVSSSSDAIHALKMIDPDMNPKDRFDSWYYTLYRKNRELADDIGLLNEEGKFEGVGIGMGVRDVIGEEGENGMFEGLTSLTRKEERFIENERILKDMAPVFFLNETGIEGREGFMDSFMKSFLDWWAPQTSELTAPLERESASNAARELKEMGIGGVSEKALESYSKRSRPAYMFGDDFSILDPTSITEIDLDGDKVGETMGMLAGAITMYGTGARVSKGVTGKGGKLADRLTRLNKKDKASGVVSQFRQTVRNSNSAARHLVSSAEEGVRFEVTGELFPDREEEFNFVSGFAGYAIGRPIYKVAVNKHTKDFTKHLVRVFGDEAPNAVKAIKNRFKTFNSLDRQMRSEIQRTKGPINSDAIKKGLRKFGGFPAFATQRGLGETGEETVQELSQVWRESEKGGNFWGDVKRKFGKANEDGEVELDLTQAQEFLITSFAMGFGFGLSAPSEYFSEKKGEVYKDATQEQKKIMNGVIEDVVDGFGDGVVEAEKAATVEEEMDSPSSPEPEYIINGERLSKEEFLSRANTKGFVDNWKHGNTEVIVKNDPDLERQLIDEYGVEPQKEEAIQEEETAPSVEEEVDQIEDTDDPIEAVNIAERTMEDLDPEQTYNELKSRVPDPSKYKNFKDFESTYSGEFTATLSRMAREVQLKGREQVRNEEGATTEEGLETNIGPEGQARTRDREAEYERAERGQEIREEQQGAEGTTEQEQEAEGTTEQAQEQVEGTTDQTQEVEQTAETEQQQTQETEGTVDQEQDTEQTQEDAAQETEGQAEGVVDEDAEAPLEEVYEEEPEITGPVRMTDEQRAVVDDGLNELESEERSGLNELIDEIENDPQNETLKDEFDQLVDQSNMSSGNKEQVKDVVRDIGEAEPSFDESVRSEEDSDALLDDIRSDIKAIENNESTPAETGIGKKINRLRQVDENAYNEAVQEYKPVHDQFKARKAAVKRDQGQQLGDAEMMTEGYVEQIELTDEHPSNVVDMGEVHSRYKNGEISKEQFDQVRSAFDEKVKGMTRRKNNYNPRETARNSAKRPPTSRVSEESYGSIVLTSLMDRLKKAFPNVKVTNDPDTVLTAWRSRTGDPNATLEDVPTGFYMNGKVYFNSQKNAGPATTLEEYAHLWIDVARNKNRELLQQGLNMVDGSKKLDEVLSDPNYSYLTVDEAQEEALAKMIADKAVERETNKNNIGQWIKDMWETVRRALNMGPRIKITDTLDQYVSKVANELRGRMPISKLSEENFIQAETGRARDVKIDNGLMSDRGWWDGVKRFGLIMFSDAGSMGMKGLNEAIRQQNGNFKMYEQMAKDKADDLTNGVKQLNEKWKKDGVDRETRKQKTEKVLQNINNALSKGHEHISELEDEVKGPAKTMRLFIDQMSKKLRSKTFLNEEVRGIITERLGFYLHRSYAKHDAGENWDETFEERIKEQYGPEQMKEIRRYIQDRFGTGDIQSVRLKRQEDGGMAVEFVNKRGVRSNNMNEEAIDELADVMSDEDYANLRDRIRKGEETTYELEETIWNQDNHLVNFTLTDQGVDTIMYEIASTGGGGSGKITPETLTELDQNAMKQKTDIAEPMRILMGEYTDPRVNFVKTITNIAMMAEKSDLETKMENDGYGVMFSSDRSPVHTEKIPDDKSNTFGGMYTTKEMHDLLFKEEKGFSEGNWFNKMIAGIVGLNGVAKANLTLFKPDSQSRNFFGGLMMLANTGNLPYGEFKNAVKVATSDFNASQKNASWLVPALALTKTMSDSFSGMSKDQVRQEFYRLIKYGLVDQSISGSIIEEVTSDMSGLVKAGKTSRKMGKMLEGAQIKNYNDLVNFASRIYQSSDLIPKTLQFMAERQRYARLKYGDDIENLTEEQREEVEQFTAERVRKEQPTYSEATKAERAVSKAPFFGAFATFAARRVRNQFAILGHASQDYKEYKRTGKIGWLKNAGRKLTGTLAMNGAFSAAMYALMSIYDWDDDEIEAFSQFFPGYSMNNQKMPLNSDKKNPQFLDLTFINPNSHMHKAVRGVMRGEEFRSGLSETFQPFIGEEIFFSGLKEAVQDMDEYGNSVAKRDFEVAPWSNIFDRAAHAFESIYKPGIYQSGQNIYRGATGYKTDYGKTYSFGNQLLNNSLGVKIKERDTYESFRNNVAGTYGNMKEERQKYKRDLRKMSSDEMDEESLKETGRAVGHDAKHWYNRIKGQARAAFVLGFSDREVRKGLDEANVPKYMQDQIMMNKKFQGVDPKTGDFLR